MFLDVDDIRIDGPAPSPTRSGARRHRLRPGRPSCRTSSRLTRGPPVRLLLPGELVYVLDLARSAPRGGLLVELLSRERKKSGEWGKPKAVIINRHDIAALPDERDRRILDAVCGAAHAHGYFGPSWSGYSVGVPVPAAFVLNLTLQRDLARRLAETGRLLVRVPATPGVRTERRVLVPVDWDPEPAEFHLRITGDARDGLHDRRRDPPRRTGARRQRRDVRHRSADRVAPSRAWRPAAPGRVRPGRRRSVDGRAPRRRPRDGAGVRRGGARRNARGLGSRASRLPRRAARRARVEPPRPIVRITRPTPATAAGTPRPTIGSTRSCRSLTAIVKRTPGPSSRCSSIPSGDVAWRRDRRGGARRLRRLQSLGVRRSWPTGRAAAPGWTLPTAQLPTVVRVLLSEGWRVEAEGRVYRPARRRVARRAIGHRLVRAARRRRLRRRQRRPAHAARRGAARRHVRAARRRHVRAAAGELAGAQRPDGRDRHAGSAITCASRRLRARCSMRGSPAQPAVSCDEAFAQRARRAGALRRRRGRRPAADVPRRPARRISATRSAGSSFLAGSGSAAASPTRWGSARRSWCWPRWRPAAPSANVPGKPITRRSSSCRARSCSTGSRRRRGSRRRLRVLDYTGAGRRDALERSASTTSSSRPMARCGATSGTSRTSPFDYAILDEAQAIKNAAHQLGQGGAAAEGAAPPGAQRHAGREPSRRAVEPVRVPEPRHARRGIGLRRRRRRRTRRPTRTRWQLLSRGLAAVHPAPHQGAGRRASCRRGPSRRFTAISSRRSARCTTSCATTTARRCSEAWRADGLGRGEAADPRGAAAAAPGGVSSRPDRPRAGRRRRRPSSTSSCRGCRSSSKTATRCSSSRSSRRCSASCARGSTKRS